MQVEQKKLLLKWLRVCAYLSFFNEMIHLLVGVEMCSFNVSLPPYRSTICR